MTMFFLGAPTPPVPPDPARETRRQPSSDDPRSWNLRLVAAGTAVPVRQVADSPMLLMAAVEDLCWEIAAEQATARRPPRWRRSRRAAWQAETDRLAAKQDRVRAMVREAVDEL